MHQKKKKTMNFGARPEAKRSTPRQNKETIRELRSIHTKRQIYPDPCRSDIKWNSKVALKYLVRRMNAH